MSTAETLRAWRENPVRFVEDVFGATADPWQVDVLMAFADPKKQRIAMKACKGPGKTTVLAWCILNFLCTRPFAKIACTSITKDNLDDNLWPEIAKWMNRSEFLVKAFTWGKTRIVANDHPAEWFCSARTWPKHGDKQKQAETLAGLHAEFLLFVLDESGGIPSSVMASAEAGLSTGTECKLMQAGNPTMLEGPLYAACTSERNLWYVVEITGDPDDPKRAKRIDVKWARDQIAKYGKDNPWVLVNVFGKFPPESINTLLGPDMVKEAMGRHLRKDQYDFSQKRLGVDPARFGDDSTIIFPRQGLAAFQPVEMRGARTHDIAARVALAKSRWQAEMILIDSTGGYGAGVEDALLQAGVNAVPVNFSSRALDNRYFNKRAEIWFLMAEWIKRGGALPNDNDLLRELTTPTYTFHNGKFRLEDKDQMKSRLGYSPDRADALAVTFALPDMPAHISLPGADQSGKVQHEYDPING